MRLSDASAKFVRDMLYSHIFRRDGACLVGTYHNPMTLMTEQGRRAVPFRALVWSAFYEPSGRKRKPVCGNLECINPLHHVTSAGKPGMWRKASGVDLAMQFKVQFPLIPEVTKGE
jgi:hypothetical protein